MAKTLRRWLLGIGGMAVAVPLFAALAWYEPRPGPGAPRVLVAVDRSAWNAIGLNRLTYVRALREAGLDPVLMDYRGGLEPEDAEAVLAGISGVVVTGGGDVGAGYYEGGDPSVNRGVKPDRDRFELALLRAAHDRSLPILGLCRGAQLLNVYLGGTLGEFRADTERYDRHRRLGAGHPVLLEPGSRLAEIYASERLESVVSWHGQHVDRPGEAVDVVGYAPDGTPEAFELRDDGAAWMVGVQWHAEFPLWNDGQDALFDAFAAAVTGGAGPPPAE